jgi:hypothetical protein
MPEPYFTLKQALKIEPEIKKLSEKKENRAHRNLRHVQLLTRMIMMGVAAGQTNAKNLYLISFFDVA